MLVRKVALAASPEAPQTVSQRAFNAARSQVTEHCPEAAYLVKRLRCPWQELLSLAFSDERTSNQSLLMRDREYTGSTASYIGALQLMARRLEVTTIRPGQYEEARQEMLKRRRGRPRQELLERLPAAGSIDVRGWDEMLALAGLERRVREVRYKGIPIPDAIERFLEVQGRLPSLRELERFGKERGLSLGRHKKILPHIEVLRSRRTNEGRWTPPRLPRKSELPPWQEVQPEEGTPLDPEWSGRGFADSRGL
jgi:hypothetical protein